MKDASKQSHLAPRWLLLVGNILKGPKDCDCLNCFSLPKFCPGINAQTGSLYRKKERLDKLPCQIPKKKEEWPQLEERELEILRRFVENMSWIMEN